MDGGAWSAAVHGVSKSWTRPSDFPFTFHFHALEKEMATHSSVLAWRIPGTGEPGGLPSMGSHRVGHDWSDLAAAAAAAAAACPTMLLLKPPATNLLNVLFNSTYSIVSETRNQFIERKKNQQWANILEFTGLTRRQLTPKQLTWLDGGMTFWILSYGMS